MRPFLRAAALAGSMLALVAAAAAAQQPAQRFAYVNPQALFDNAPGRAEAEAAFRKETDAYRTELTKMNDDLNKLLADYQKAEPTLTPEQKDSRQRAIAAKEDSLRARQQELEQQAGQRQNELMAPIMESVRKVLEDIRAEEGYSIIFSSEPGASPILAADKNLDITDRVVARLRTLAASRPTTTAPKPTGAPVAAPSGVTRPKPPGV